MFILGEKYSTHTFFSWNGKPCHILTKIDFMLLASFEFLIGFHWSVCLSFLFPFCCCCKYFLILSFSTSLFQVSVQHESTGSDIKHCSYYSWLPWFSTYMHIYICVFECVCMCLLSSLIFHMNLEFLFCTCEYWHWNFYRNCTEPTEHFV